MITHHDVRSVIANLEINASTKALLTRYVDDQAALDERSDPIRRANAAERRSDEAIARFATLSHVVQMTEDRLTEIEKQVRIMMEIIIEVTS